MSDTSSVPIPLDPAQARAFEHACNRFEAARRNGERPQVEAFVADLPEDLRPALREELAGLESYYEAQGEQGVCAVAQGQMTTVDISRGPESTLSLSRPSCRSVGNYEILEKLGRGGMGVVYKARHAALQRTVALKMILFGGHADRGQLERFRIEARAIARLQHPHIVQIHEVGEHEGLPYFALEFCPGGSLEKKLAGTPLPAKQAAALIEKLARALHAVHEKGVIHRDLKPANVLLAEDGAPKISDFGLAKKLDEQGQTASGAVLGTPSYMAPEQAGLANPGGKLGEVGPACDIYGLGAILYECLTGRPPFRAATSLDTILQVVSAEPVPPRQLNSQVPADLETICLKCLHKEPARRYQTAAALAEDLQRFLADEPISARPVGRSERLARWCQRNPWLAGTSAALILLLVLVAVGSVVAALLFNEERLVAQANEKDAQDNLQRALTAEKDKTQQLWLSHLAEAQARRWSGQAGRRFLSLAALKKAAAIRPTLELRNEAIACMALLDVRVAKEWDGCPGDTGQVPRLIFDAGLKHYARSDAKTNIEVRRVADDTMVARLPGMAGLAIVTLQFSPDSRLLAVCYCPASRTYENQLCLWDIAAGRKLLHLERQMNAYAMDFSPDGRLFALGCQDRSLRLYRTSTGEEVSRHPSSVAPESIHFHPDGQKLAIRYRNSVRIHEVTAGKLIRNLSAKDELRDGAQHPDGGLRDLAWHPDGGLLAGSCTERIHLWNAHTGALQRTLEGHPDSVATSINFSHAGDVLVSTGWDYSVKLWHPSTGKLLLSLDNVDTRTSLQFSPDDKLLAYNTSGSKLQLWEVRPSRECLQLYGVGQRDAAIHPNGRLAAVADTSGVRLWDLARSEPLAFLPLRHGRSVLFHPDGKSLITSGPSGLQRWPIQGMSPGEPGRLRIGPPQALWTAAGIGQASLSPGGDRIVAASYGGQGALIDWDDPDKKVLFGHHERMMFVSLSPDGRWLASGGWVTPDVNIWDGKTGAFVCKLPGVLHTARPHFSLDGRWLVTAEPNEHRFWEVGSWKLVRRLPRARGGMAGPVAFSPDGSMAALASSPNTIQLLDVATKEEIATLVPADRRSFEGMQFSSDGSRLAVSAQGVLQVWDLRLVRAGLAELGLDWDAPAYSGNGGPMDAARPERLQVEVIGEARSK